MKHLIKSIMAVGALLLASCASQPSLQEYYVDNSENPNFLSIDVPASILKMDEVNLTPTQKEAIESLRKFNLLAFKKNADNEAEYEIEKKKVREILKGDQFVELMKINSKYGKGTIQYLGDEDAIDEVIIFGDSQDKGFALVRVLGKDMNPAHIIQLMQAIEKSDYKGEGLGEIGDFLKG
ncbi:DUF4252 domain-containing protein [Flagellimonas oceanensis]|uniref:DUF4252 domain-containing protein n=1 Tax=Flagellimonas oceanensis TaxID=2499163 RepID=UPI000F8EC834|nr:DUF4252 domain-containing protein [Allomuricauda oceanensis]|tara:strand:+ start:3393 stop:3932 length:540 start_codon:yes stop_codon:yes gene_type:complete